MSDDEWPDAYAAVRASLDLPEPNWWSPGSDVGGGSQT